MKTTLYYVNNNIHSRKSMLNVKTHVSPHLTTTTTIATSTTTTNTTIFVIISSPSYLRPS